MGIVYDQFKTVEELPEVALGKIVQPSPDKVLRLVPVPGTTRNVLRPSSAAMHLVLRYGQDLEAPDVDTVRASLQRSTPAATSGVPMQ